MHSGFEFFSFTLGSEGVPDDPQITTEDIAPFSLEPQFSRPLPPVLQPSEHEILWLDPVVVPEFCLDPLVGADESMLQEIDQLLARAFKQALTPAQLQVRFLLVWISAV